MPRLTLYEPINPDKDSKREMFRKIVKEVGSELGIEYAILEGDEDTFIINIEDEEASTLLFIDDDSEDRYESIKTMVKVLATIALSSEVITAEKEEERIRMRLRRR